MRFAGPLNPTTELPWSPPSEPPQATATVQLRPAADAGGYTKRGDPAAARSAHQQENAQAWVPDGQRFGAEDRVQARFATMSTPIPKCKNQASGWYDAVVAEVHGDGAEYTLNWSEAVQLSQSVQAWDCVAHYRMYARASLQGQREH